MKSGFHLHVYLILSHAAFLEGCTSDTSTETSFLNILHSLIQQFEEYKITTSWTEIILPVLGLVFVLV